MASATAFSFSGRRASWRPSAINNCMMRTNSVHTLRPRGAPRPMFDTLHNSTISVRKPDGALHQNIKATISSGLIIFDAKGILLETGDLIHRVMSNGGEETYEVIDPRFHEQLHGMPAHYQASVLKLGIPEARHKKEAMTINVTAGNYSRVNFQSVDQSTNVVSSQATEHLNALEAAIEGLALANDKHREAIELLESIRSQFDSGKPNRTILKALLGALPAVGNISSIAALLLSIAQ